MAVKITRLKQMATPQFSPDIRAHRRPASFAHLTQCPAIWVVNVSTLLLAFSTPTYVAVFALHRKGGRNWAYPAACAASRARWHPLSDMFLRSSSSGNEVLG
jgi:hypothetical protein